MLVFPRYSISVYLILFSIWLPSVRAQRLSTDSLLQALPASKGEVRTKILHELAFNLLLNYPDSSLKYVNESIELSKELKNNRLLSISYRQLAAVYGYQSLYDSDRYYNKRALELARSVKDSTLITSILNNIGTTYLNTGDYAEALDYFKRSYNLKIKINQEYGQSNVLNNIGGVYLKLQDYTSAHYYLSKALKLAEQTNDIDRKLYSTNNIGLTYLQSGNIDEAKKYFLIAKAITRQINNKNWTAVTYDGLGQVSARKKLIKDAKENFRLALKLRNEIRDKKGISETYYHLAQMFQEMQIDSAFYYLYKSQAVANTIESHDRLLENYYEFYLLFDRTRRKDSAIHYLKLFSDLQNTQFRENTTRNIQDIDIRLREEEQQQLLQIQNAQLTLKSIQLYLIAIIAFVTIVAIVIILWYYNKQKTLAQNLETVNQAMLNKNEELHDLNQEKNNLIGIVAHDLKSPLNHIKGLVSLLKESLKNSDEESKHYVQMIETSTTRLTNMIGKILDIEAIESADLNVNLESIDLGQAVQIVMDRYQMPASQKKIQILSDLESSVVVTVDKNYIDQIVENLLSNALKFSPPGKRIFISVSRKLRSGQLEIKDEGPGLTDLDKKKLFNKYQKLSATPTAFEGSSGLGLSIVKKFTEAMHGEIRFESVAGHGANFILTFPLSK